MQHSHNSAGTFKRCSCELCCMSNADGCCFFCFFVVIIIIFTSNSRVFYVFSCTSSKWKSSKFDSNPKTVKHTRVNIEWIRKKMEKIQNSIEEKYNFALNIGNKEESINYVTLHMWTITSYCFFFVWNSNVRYLLKQRTKWT